MSPIRSIVLGCALSLGALSAAEAKSSILFLLDASSSMWGRVDGAAKIETAKEKLRELIGALPADTEAGLMVYGHRNATSCEDVELVLPIGKPEDRVISAALKTMTARGKTPMAYALGRARDPLAQRSGDDLRNVVLISDGVETCGGDPCAAAEQLAAENINVRVHVVGFDIAEKDRAALQCIALKGRGRYFSASSTAGFSEAVAAVVKVAQVDTEPVLAQAPVETVEEPEPEPAETTETETRGVELAQADPPPPAPRTPAMAVFTDGFDGGDLGPAWDVMNRNPDRLTVEEGELLLIGRGESGFRNAQTANIVRLTEKMPGGDWELAADLRFEAQTGRDSLWLGLYQDEANFIAAHLFVNKGYCSEVSIEVVKRQEKEESLFKKEIVKQCGEDKLVVPVLKRINDEGVRLRLVKNGRKFRAAVDISGPGGGTFETQDLTSLRALGTAALAIGQYEDTKGENLVYVDQLEILTSK